MARRKTMVAVVGVLGLLAVIAVFGMVGAANDAGFDGESAPSLGTSVVDSFAGDAGDKAAPEELAGDEGFDARGLVDGSGSGSSGDAGVPAGPDGGFSIGADSAVEPLPGILPGNTRVIKNASLQIEIEEGEFQKKFARASAVADELGGFVNSSRVSQTDGSVMSGSVTIRVPSDRFETAVARLKDLGEVTGEERSGQDVTREFIDVEARLRQARTEEGFFIKLLDEAETISDLIQIQSQLSGVQLRIEQLQGQLNYLEDQTSYSTVSAYLYEPGAESNEPPTGIAEAWQRAGDGFQTVVSGAIISAGWLAPFALLALLLFGAFRMKKRSRDAKSG